MFGMMRDQFGEGTFKESDKWKSLGMKRAIRWAAEPAYRCRLSGWRADGKIVEPADLLNRRPGLFSVVENPG